MRIYILFDHIRWAYCLPFYSKGKVKYRNLKVTKTGALLGPFLKNTVI